MQLTSPVLRSNPNPHQCMYGRLHIEKFGNAITGLLLACNLLSPNQVGKCFDLLF
jgi:hypothetical protein